MDGTPAAGPVDWPLFARALADAAKAATPAQPKPLFPFLSRFSHLARAAKPADEDEKPKDQQPADDPEDDDAPAEGDPVDDDAPAPDQDDDDEDDDGQPAEKPKAAAPARRPAMTVAAALDRLNRAASALRAADPKLTKEQAFQRACHQDAEAYGRYRTGYQAERANPPSPRRSAPPPKPKGAALAELEKRAAELRRREPGLTAEQAFGRVCRAHPALYDRYQAAERAARRR